VNGDKADREAARLGANLGDVGGRARALTAQPVGVQAGQVGIHSLTISRLDPAECDRLALIITRLDADEHLDPVGRYQIDVASAVGAE